MLWEVGKTVQEIFKTDDPSDPAIASHLNALNGVENVERLTGEFSNLNLKVLPLHDDTDTNSVVGCISILNSVSDSSY